MKHLITLLLFVVFTAGSLMANPDGRDVLSSDTKNNTTATQQQETQTSTSALNLEDLKVTDEATANASDGEVTAPASVFQNMSEKEMRKMERKAQRAKKFINRSAKSGKKAGFFTRVAAKLKMAMLKNFMGDNQIVAILLVIFLGGWGVHRVYMGGRGILILLYFITCGGIFGILPLIDLIMLIIDPDRYINNDKFIAL